MGIELNDSVDVVLRKWPATFWVFLEHGLRCAGCPLACFCTVKSACEGHGVDAAAFLEALRAGAEDGSLRRPLGQHH
jgi:hybrid cluster-associated redox disulfide protein